MMLYCTSLSLVQPKVSLTLIADNCTLRKNSTFIWRSPPCNILTGTSTKDKGKTDLNPWCYDDALLFVGAMFIISTRNTGYSWLVHESDHRIVYIWFFISSFTLFPHRGVVQTFHCQYVDSLYLVLVIKDCWRLKPKLYPADTTLPLFWIIMIL